jgi:hypothetical protein
MSAEMEPAQAEDRQPIDILGDALDEHAWRAESFAGALSHITESGGSVDVTALAAIAEGLEEHVSGLVAAARDAHEALRLAREARA